MIIGIAGGIGSGKTLAADYLFNNHQFEILDNDVTAREIVEKGSPLLDIITDHFGLEILTENQTLNRPVLRQKIFDNPREKIWLESVTHPEIRKRTLAKIASVPQNQVILLVSPLLYESRQHELCDETVVICSSRDNQIKRVHKRDGSSNSTIESIINHQYSNEQRIKLATHVLYNDSTIDNLYHQLDELVSKWSNQLLKN